MKLPAPVMYPTSARYWKLAEPYSFEWGATRFTAPAGWRTDGASIPRALWRVLGHPFTGDLLPAALPHDVLYAVQLTTRAEADRLFYARLLENLVDTTPKGGRWAKLQQTMQNAAARAKAWTLYAGVRAGGWVAWRGKETWSIEAARKHVEVQIGVTDETVKPHPDALIGGGVVLIAVLLIALALTGCATVEFDPATGKAKYSRWGDQKVSLTVERTGPESWKLELAQESEAAALTEMAKTINRLAELAGPK